MDFFNNFSTNLISRHKTKKLFTIYLKHILTIVIMPLLVFVIIIAIQFFNSYKIKTDNYIKSIAKERASYVDSLFSKIDTYYKHCISDYDISVLLSGSYLMNNVSGDNIPIKKVSDDVNILNKYTNAISSVYLYSEYNDYVYGLYGNTSSHLDTFPDKEWYNEYIRQNSSNYITQIDEGSNSYITFCYNLNFSTNKNGILVIKIENNNFFGVSNSTLDNQFNIKIIDNNSFKIAECLKCSDVNYSEFFIPLENFIGTLVYSVPKSSIQIFKWSTLSLLLLLVLTSIILTTALSLIFSRKQYRSILSVISAIESPYIHNNDILYEVIESENNPALANKNIENELVNKVTNLKKAQLIALQTQINPHFIFNTLNMISYSIIDNNDEDTEAVHMISLLSDILRHSLETEKYIVPLEKEIESLKAYTSILEMRYGHSFDILFDIEEESLNTQTLKSILQPLVENSVKHGIKRLYEKKQGLLKIKVYKKNDLLFMQVIDNGVGIPPDELEQLNNRLNSDIIFKNKNIGLHNVISRIKLLFGNKGGFIIQSNPEETSVTIYHPIIKSHMNNE